MVSDNNTAGAVYILECTTVTGAMNITWLDPMNNQITSGVMITGSMSTLTLNPLAASHAGKYTCKALVNGIDSYAQKDVIVQSKRLNS